MKYKLVCVDMDGTLLDSSKKIKKRNIEVIRKADKLGVKVVLTTGRGYPFAKKFRKEMGISTPIIASNGAYIVDGHEVMMKNVIPIETANTILDVMNRHKVKTFIHTTEDIVYRKKDISRFLAKKFFGDSIKEIDSFEGGLKDNKDNLLKFVGISISSKKIDKVKKVLRKIDNVEVVSSSKFNCEVMIKGSSKGEAVRMMAEKYNIKQEEIMCIGDNENDLSMLQYAGCAVAMGNGTKEVKDIADYITSSNNNCGVAQAIEKLILIDKA